MISKILIIALILLCGLYLV